MIPREALRFAVTAILQQPVEVQLNLPLAYCALTVIKYFLANAYELYSFQYEFQYIHRTCPLLETKLIHTVQLASRGKCYIGDALN